MTDYAINGYSMNSLLCAIGLILCIIVVKNEYQYDRERGILSQSQLLRLLTYSTMIICITEIIYSIFTADPSPDHYHVMTVNYMFLLMSMCLTSYLWLLYCIIRSTVYIPNIKLVFMLLSIPVAVLAVLCVISPFTQVLFYIGRDDGLYHEGYFPIIPWILDPLYILSGAFIAMLRKKNEFRSFPVLGVVFAIVAGAVLQRLTGGMCTIGVSIAIALVAVSVSVKNEQAYTDQLTDLYNRQYVHDRLDQRLKRKPSGDRKYIGIEFDLDKFKEINDTFGHAMGDRALKQFGYVLKTLGKGTAIRTGGDEFVVVFAGSRLTDADDIIREVRDKVENINRLSHDPFRILFSAGAAVFTDEMEGFEDLTAAMDEEMYRDKEQHRAERMMMWNRKDTEEHRQI